MSTGFLLINLLRGGIGWCKRNGLGAETLPTQISRDAQTIHLPEYIYADEQVKRVDAVFVV